MASHTKAFKEPREGLFFTSALNDGNSLYEITSITYSLGVFTVVYADSTKTRDALTRINAGKVAAICDDLDADGVFGSDDHSTADGNLFRLPLLALGSEPPALRNGLAWVTVSGLFVVVNGVVKSVTFDA